MEFYHEPVLLNECIDSLKIKEDGKYLDGTVGGGGHSLHILEHLGEKGHLYCMDQDIEAVKSSKERLLPYGDKVTLIHDNFENAFSRLQEYGVSKVDGILLDIGVSSYQLDEPERGFSYRYDSPLDMRMDRRKEYTAKDLVNNYSERELFRVISEYGEERFAKRIAKNIVAWRKNKTIETTFELVGIIKDSIPASCRIAGKNPAKRTFQAIRIELNSELDILEKSIDDMIDMLEKKGRLCIITFHSLEDRIVKRKFKEAEFPCTCPRDFPVCVCGKKPKGIVIAGKPILPTTEEIKKNSRAKSAKLRVFERT